MIKEAIETLKLLMESFILLFKIDPLFFIFFCLILISPGLVLIYMHYKRKKIKHLKKVLIATGKVIRDQEVLIKALKERLEKRK